MTGVATAHRDHAVGVIYDGVHLPPSAGGAIDSDLVLERVATCGLFFDVGRNASVGEVGDGTGDFATRKDLNAEMVNRAGLFAFSIRTSLSGGSSIAKLASSGRRLADGTLERRMEVDCYIEI